MPATTSQRSRTFSPYPLRTSRPGHAEPRAGTDTGGSTGKQAVGRARIANSAVAHSPTELEYQRDERNAEERRPTRLSARGAPMRRLRTAGRSLRPRLAGRPCGRAVHGRVADA